MISKISRDVRNIRYIKEGQGYQETKGIVRDSKCISNVEDINDINNENHQEFEIIFIAKVKLTK